MAKSRHTTKKAAKATVKVQDLSPKNDPKGGRKAGTTKQEYMIFKLKDVIIT